MDKINTRIQALGWDGVVPEERDIANAAAFYGSANIGGVDDIYFNSPYLGDMASELYDSLLRVGAVRAAYIFLETFSYFPNGSIPTTLDGRVCILRRCGDAPFRAWNRRFFAEAEDCYVTLHHFITSNAALFHELQSGMEEPKQPE